MKRILKFSTFESEKSLELNQDQLDFLNLYAKDWKINPTTGKIDAYYVENHVDRQDVPVKIPEGLYFGKIKLHFQLRNCDISSWEGFPDETGGSLNVSRNNFSSLDGCPSKIGFSFRIWMNQNLTSLVGCPTEIGGGLDVSYCSLKNLVGSPPVINGSFSCERNQLQSLKGAPKKVDGDFDCSGNPLQSLEGAPEIIMGSFNCGEFELGKGEWNMEGWLEVLENGSEKAKKLILTLPIFNPTFWNSKISENPESTIIELSGFWDDLPDEFRNSIRIPSDLRDDFDNLLELVRSGIM